MNAYQKKQWIFAGLIGTVFIVLVFLSVQIAGSTDEPSGPSIAATTFPIYDITQHIAGDTIQTILILPPGASPHTYEPSPSDLKRLQYAQVVYANGLGLDDWASVITDSLNIPTVVLATAIEPLPSDDEEEHGTYDPHYWLSINNATKMAEAITADLSRRFPDQASTFEERLNLYQRELTATDEEIRAILNTRTNRPIVTFHNSFAYFARDYHLNVIGTFEPTAGREPTSQELIQLTQAIHDADVTTLFSEVQFSTLNLSSFLQDNQISLAQLDPIGGNEHTATYIDLMLYNANVIAQHE